MSICVNDELGDSARKRYKLSESFWYSLCKSLTMGEFLRG